MAELQLGKPLQKHMQSEQALVPSSQSQSCPAAARLVLPPGYLSDVYEEMRAEGAICIADEIQTGFGRVGSAFWAFQVASDACDAYYAILYDGISHCSTRVRHGWSGDISMASCACV